MFNSFGKMLIDQGQATRNERGDMVIGGMGGMNPLLSVQGNRVIMASSEDRLSAVVAALKGGMPAPLSSDPTFRACIGESASPTVIYVKFGKLLELIRDAIPERAQKKHERRHHAARPHEGRRRRIPRGRLERHRDREGERADPRRSSC